MPLGSFRLNGLAKYFAPGEDGLVGYTLWAAGFNSQGQIGDGSTTQRTSFVNSGSTAEWAQISKGNGHSLALKSNRTIWSWGNNFRGGTGLGLDSGNTLTPTQVGSATNWAQVSAGGSHSLAITTTGELWAWGGNFAGQLGLGDSGLGTERLTPTRVGSATNWASVSAGASHSLAITTTGELWAWGGNGNGQLGRGNTTSPQTTPIRIGSATNWAQVSAGDSYSLAITTTSQLWSWGDNSNGRTGLNTSTGNTTSPTRVGSATNWAQVIAGQNHSLAITTTGELWAWGRNFSGALGLGNTTDRTTPTRVGSATNWVSISAGNLITLAINSSGQLWGAGFNNTGSLGLGDTNDRTTLTQVGSATNWVAVSAGGNNNENTSLALRS